MQEKSKTIIVAPAECNDKEAFSFASSDGSDEHFFCLEGINEADIFEGSYPDIRTYYDTILPQLRTDLEGIFARENPLVMVYLGCELSTLYAAYYAIVNGVRVALTVVNPQFMGGKSPWIQAHPLLLNRLITTVISNAFEVKIRGKEHFDMLPKAFPKIAREFVLADLPEPETASEDALRSPSKGVKSG